MKLSELRALAKSAPRHEGPSPTMVRAIQQSLRVEGYDISERDVIAAYYRVMPPS